MKDRPNKGPGEWIRDRFRDVFGKSQDKSDNSFPGPDEGAAGVRRKPRRPPRTPAAGGTGRPTT